MFLLEYTVKQLVEYMIPATKIMGIVLCGVIIMLLCYKIFFKESKEINKISILAFVAFIGYLFVVLCITYLSRDDLGYGMGGTNFALFWSYRYAWNTFCFENWKQVIGNVIMFIPLGILLPLMLKIFQNFLVCFCTGFFCSFLIETSQLITGRGLFEIDDLLNNTLGAVLGYCIIRVVIELLKKEKKKYKIFLFTFIPTLIIGMFGYIFYSYEIQEFGNFPMQYAIVVDTSKYLIYSDYEFSNEMQEKPVYIYTHRKDKIYAKEKINQVLNQLGYNGKVQFEKIDKNYICGYIGSASITFNINTGTWNFSDSSKIQISEDNYIEGMEIQIEKNLRNMGVFPDAVMQYSGNLKWESLEKSGERKSLSLGSFQCTITENGEICSINNDIIVRDYIKDIKIESEAVVFQRFKQGKFKTYEIFSENDRIKILKCYVGYWQDTKGFYRPVYTFEYLLNEENKKYISIPATISENF